MGKEIQFILYNPPGGDGEVLAYQIFFRGGGFTFGEFAVYKGEKEQEYSPQTIVSK